MNFKVGDKVIITDHFGDTTSGDIIGKVGILRSKDIDDSECIEPYFI